MAYRSVTRLISSQKRLCLPAYQMNLGQRAWCHAGVKSLVEQRIASNRVVVFSKSFCPFCKMAKDVLNEYIPHHLEAKDYDVMEIEDLEHMEQIQDYLKILTGASSVPRIFVEGKFIGGGTDIVNLHDNGKLGNVLKK